MSRKAIHSDNAPAAIGTYSQAVRSGDLVFLSGQIPLDPATMEFVEGDFEARARQVFDNLRAVAEAGLPVSPLPGPSALAAALSVSGFAEAGRSVRFVGFLPGFFPGLVDDFLCLELSFRFDLFRFQSGFFS